MSLEDMKTRYRARPGNVDFLQDLDLFYIKQLAQSYKEHDLEQKIDIEMKMREGTTKLLQACKHRSQLLEGAKSLLTSNERMTAYMAELQRRKGVQNGVKKDKSDGSSSLGRVCISNLHIPLIWKDSDYFKNKGDHRRFVVFCLVKIGTEIYDTSLVNPVDRSTTDICFDDVLVFNGVPPDFKCVIEVYSHMVCDDLSIASTPRRIKKTLHTSISRTIGKKLALSLKDELAHGEMGPHFDLVAQATLTVDDVSDTETELDTLKTGRRKSIIIRNRESPKTTYLEPDSSEAFQTWMSALSQRILDHDQWGNAAMEKLEIQSPMSSRTSTLGLRGRPRFASLYEETSISGNSVLAVKLLVLEPRSEEKCSSSGEASARENPNPARQHSARTRSMSASMIATLSTQRECQGSDFEYCQMYSHGNLEDEEDLSRGLHWQSLRTAKPVHVGESIQKEKGRGIIPGITSQQCQHGLARGQGFKNENKLRDVCVSMFGNVHSLDKEENVLARLADIHETRKAKALLVQAEEVTIMGANSEELKSESEMSHSPEDRKHDGLSVLAQKPNEDAQEMTDLSK
ncbi:unnamed protein product [Darwinula stevensoni]|uniref:REM-1 domain-containing protein n=1 Tax=Darwinula stevensoni TaxID=69355 RepID=A0A7R9A178_9CRUS|nr:unnamed protein product [Darwinula stevensoni]CAG0887171.1 unnamed protein product [Darwinula stevensoni]